MPRGGVEGLHRRFTKPVPRLVQQRPGFWTSAARSVAPSDAPTPWFPAALAPQKFDTVFRRIGSPTAAITAHHGQHERNSVSLNHGVLPRPTAAATGASQHFMTLFPADRPRRQPPE
jgi:hypothetical protein